MRRQVAFVILLAILTLSGREANAAGWMRLRSAHFTIEGDVGASELRAMALRLEQFRETIARALPSATLVTPAPVAVLMLGRPDDVKAVAPRYDGKPIRLAGFATTSMIGSSLVIGMEYRSQAYSIAYHEYGHLLINNAMFALPLWVQEGMAEFYGTFELSRDGRRATLGTPIEPERISLLRGRLLPMQEVLAATHGSELYNVDSDRSLFYAQSWALVHYLLLGDPERHRQFNSFLQRLAAGEPAEKAFPAAFPNAGYLADEVRGYVHQSGITVAQITFADRVTGAAEYPVAPMTPADAEAAMGMALVEQGRLDEARARFEQALKGAPETAAAQTGLGLLLTMKGSSVDGLRALRKGAELADDDPVAHFALGYAAQLCSTRECLAEGGGAESARRHFQRAVDLQPEFPEALALLAMMEGAAGPDIAQAEDHLRRAIALLPGREDYRLMLGQLYLRHDQFAKAQAVLGPIAAASRSGQKARARQLLGQVAEAMRLAAERSAAPPGLTPSAAAGARSNAESPAAAAAPPSVFRAMSGEEQRLDGVLETIQCPTGGAVVVTVRDGAGPHRFSSPALTAIEFITYREDFKGHVTCGPQPAAMRVYLTWRPAAKGEPPPGAGIEGWIVAVEFLPKVQ